MDGRMEAMKLSDLDRENIEVLEALDVSENALFLHFLMHKLIPLLWCHLRPFHYSHIHNPLVQFVKFILRYPGHRLNTLKFIHISLRTPSVLSHLVLVTMAHLWVIVPRTGASPVAPSL